MNARFKDLIAESLDFVQFLFKTDIVTTNCGAIALERAELQADNEQACLWEWESHGKCPMGWDGMGWDCTHCISHGTYGTVAM